MAANRIRGRKDRGHGFLRAVRCLDGRWSRGAVGGPLGYGPAAPGGDLHGVVVAAQTESGLTVTVEAKEAVDR